MIFAIEAHNATNHTYDNKPYSVHLVTVTNIAQQYLHLIPYEHRKEVLAACWLHDTIEDCRLTYNDLKKEFGETVAEIVYAVTNDKGKTRSERAGDKYYEGIRRTPYASFVKLCDRWANIQYSVQTNSKMLSVYEKEHNHFIEQVLSLDDVKLYENMIEGMKNSLFIPWKGLV